MNSEDIIRMAYEAMPEIAPDITEEELERFAALVAAAERESLANILEHQCKIMADYHDVKWLSELARAIRKRGEK
jgi:hypothetical protein